MLVDHHRAERRDAILRLLASGTVRRQQELARLLKKSGYAVTQSSVSRDLRELGVSKAGGRYLPPPDETAHASGNFNALSQFVRGLKFAGPSITVIRTSVGAAQSVAVAIDRADWPEVAGTISGDDTIFIATPDERSQRRLAERLHSIFRI